MSHEERNSAKKDLIETAWQRSRRTYGYRRITDWIRREKGLQINHKAVLRLMQALGIRSVARKRKYYTHWEEKVISHRYPNLLDRNFQAAHPNQKWVTDVTYIQTGQGTMYLSVIKDLYDGFIVAYHTSTQNALELVTTTLKYALQHETTLPGLTLHSDQGGQYRSHAYFAITQGGNISASMSRPGNCWDNAPVENFFSHLKEEAIRQVKLISFQQTREVIDDYIYFYNYERIQLKTKLTPFELRCQSC
jgi:putative transposase